MARPLGEESNEFKKKAELGRARLPNSFRFQVLSPTF
jgi:hypothetical protein